MNEFNNRSADIELATNLFIDLGTELYEGLLIVDPALARCCNALYVTKYDFLTFLSLPLVDEEEPANRARSERSFRVPSPALQGLDLEAVYREVSLRMQRGDKAYWPSFGDWTEDAEEIRISFEKPDQAFRLIEIISRQNALLKQAREGLRTLLAKSFSVEELLYQADTAPYRKL